MLEYGSFVNPMVIESVPIKEISQKLNQMNKEDCIIPFDIRPTFLTEYNNNILYYSKHIYKMKKYNVINNFITPYFSKNDQNSNLLNIQCSYEPEIDTILRKYKKYIDNTFKSIRNDIEKSLTITQQIRHDLQHVWKNVADYYVLQHLLCLNSDVLNSNEIIVICGKEHYYNIQNILRKVTFELSHQTGNSEKCVNLYKSLTISNLILKEQ